MMPAPQQTFTPSVTTVYPVGQLVSVITLPPVDAANPALLLLNLGPTAMAVMAGNGSQAVFNAPGSLTLPPGKPTLTALSGLTGGTMAAVQAQGGANLQVMRGTLVDVWIMPGSTVV